MRKYLLKKDTPDLRDHVFYSGVYKSVAHLPNKVDLRDQCSTVVDQGELGSCTANAIASGLREYLFNKNKQPWIELSRLFLYWEERNLEGTVNEDSGAEIRDGMKVLQKIGVCPETDWPYDISTFTNPPIDKMVTDVAIYKVSEYHRIKTLDQLKAALAEGLPVVIGIDIYESFECDEVAETRIVPMPRAMRGNNVLADMLCLLSGMMTIKSREVTDQQIPGVGEVTVNCSEAVCRILRAGGVDVLPGVYADCVTPANLLKALERGYVL